MNIIIEGPDCSGKSTLISQTFRDHIVVHNGVYRSPIEAFDAYLNQIPDPAILKGSTPLVLDRSYISEQIYGPIYRQRGLDDFQVRLLESAYRRIKAVVVLCTPPKAMVLTEWKRRQSKGQEYIHNSEIFDQIVEMYYNDIDSVTTLPVITYDFTVQNPEDLKKRIVAARGNFYE